MVTTLFCDVVSFTAMSEAADPEDVHAVMARYFAAARSSIEAFGGTVEKFIGDAVMGVFGVPAAREDDPERAVRAGLRITEHVAGLTRPDGRPFRVRVGINTGEALVRLDVTAGSGEGVLTGDTVNTAARIQAAAPLMGVAVGRKTYEATRSVFEYVELETAVAKGKSQPVEVWEAVAPLARFGTDLTRRHDSPLVGRESDLEVMRTAFEETVTSGTPQLVTILGEPGLGKSRLVAELFHHIDAWPGPVTWRQGQCLPYGEGTTFWALGEIVKGHAGILDTDPTGVAVEKLEAVLPDAEERAWIRQRLLPLLGIEGSSQADQLELFTAWRRFLEHVAARGPMVAVFEDLHWADPALVAFVEHLAGAEDVALLIVATARPELAETCPGFGAALGNSSTISLDPLTAGETTRLVSALLDTIDLPEALRDPLVARVGGNPLFAGEYVRLLHDHDLVERVGERVVLRPGVDLPLPDNVQALIAARLDALPPDRKAVLADAAVIGTAFWTGAVAAMSGRPRAELVEVMQELTRKNLVRPVPSSTMAGEQEFTFWHVLTRDVAYGQLTRAARAARHVAAAEWLEQQADDRVEDLADTLAHHYVTALELARAVGDDVIARSIQPSAARFLLLAGERALHLDASSAYDQLARAAALTSPQDPLRPRLALAYGMAARNVGSLAEAQELLEEATASFRAARDVSGGMAALWQLQSLLQVRGDPGWLTAAARAQELLEGLPPGPLHVDAYALLANREGGLSHEEACLEAADRGLALVDQLSLEPTSLAAVSARGWRGMARCSLGDDGGLDDLGEAVRLATTAGRGLQGAIFFYNMAASLVCMRGPVAAVELLERGSAYCEARGLAEMGAAMSAVRTKPLVALGELEEVEGSAAALAITLEAQDAQSSLLEVRSSQVLATVLRGTTEVPSALDSLVESSRTMRIPEAAAAGLGAAALVSAAAGRTAVALGLFTELAHDPDVGACMDAALQLPMWVRALIALNEPALAEQLTEALSSRHPLGQHAHVAVAAMLAEWRGDPTTALSGYLDAADRWHDFTMYVEEAFALLGQGRCLLALDRADEASPVLQRARDTFARMDARPALLETEALLASLT